MNLIALPAFADNYIWMLHDGRQALVVDPGDATPVLETLERLGLHLSGILVTHHHGDHVGGLQALAGSAHGGAARILGPSDEPMPVPAAAVTRTTLPFSRPWPSTPGWASRRWCWPSSI